MGPKHAIIGEEYGTDLPQVGIAEQDLSAERNAAKFSRTKEFQRLKEHLEARIEYYQTFLPNGEMVFGKSPDELAARWAISNAVIAEFKMVIGFYEQAQEVVKADAERRQTV